MTNMSYCRFQNTYKDLLDCYETLQKFDRLQAVGNKYGVDEYGDELSKEEEKARLSLLELCNDIVNEFCN